MSVNYYDSSLRIFDIYHSNKEIVKVALEHYRDCDIPDEDREKVENVLNRLEGNE